MTGCLSLFSVPLPSERKHLRISCTSERMVKLADQQHDFSWTNPRSAFMSDRLEVAQWQPVGVLEG